MEIDIVQALTISQLERATGVPRTSIHYYVREGLLPQPQKTAGTRALYSEHHVALLQRIAEAKAAGRTLSEIRAGLQPRLIELHENAVDLEAQEYERTHRAILDLATREFVKNGYRGTRLADLIRRLGVSSSVFYGHFPSKRHLWVECYRTLVEWSRAYLEPRLAESDDMVHRLLVRTAAGFTLHGLSSDLLALTRTEALHEQPELRGPMEEIERRIGLEIAAELAAFRPPGAPPPQISLEMLAHTLTTAVHSGLTRAAWDSSFSLLEFVRTHVWLWLAVRAALAGRSDVDAELAACDDRIQQLVDSPPPVFSDLADQDPLEEREGRR